MSKIPKFKTDREAADFWDAHSPLDYLDQLKPSDVTFERAQKEVVAIRLDRPMVDILDRVARSKGIGRSPLIRMWLMERLRLELAEESASKRRRVGRAA